MNFMISSRHPLTLLQKATERKVDYKDIERLKDFISDDWTCQAQINIYVPRNQEIEWEIFKMYKGILNIIFAVENSELIRICHQNEYKCYWSYPASSYWELRGLLDLGVDEVLLDAPLYFDLPKVKRLCGKKVELRIQVNQCFNNYMDRRNGICGTYVRPEDVEQYAEYIEHMEFITDDLIKEKTLYQIYTEQKHWPGNLNLLLTNLKISVDNRGFEVLPTDFDGVKNFANRRIRCGHKCQSNPYSCHYCEQTFNLIRSIDRNSPELLKKLKALEAKENN